MPLFLGSLCNTQSWGCINDLLFLIWHLCKQDFWTGMVASGLPSLFFLAWDLHPRSKPSNGCSRFMILDLLCLEWSSCPMNGGHMGERSCGPIVCCLVAKSCSTLCGPAGSSIRGISQARILERVAISFSRGIFPTHGSNLHLLHCRQILYCWATREGPLLAVSAWNKVSLMWSWEWRGGVNERCQWTAWNHSPRLGGSGRGSPIFLAASTCPAAITLSYWGSSWGDEVVVSGFKWEMRWGMRFKWDLNLDFLE